MPVIDTNKPLTLNCVERLCALRYFRNVKDRIDTGMLELQEKINGNVDVLPNTSAYRALDADKAIVDTIIRKLWVLDQTSAGSQ